MARTAVVIAGATATGKTELGERIAAAVGGEIVCADARQLFRELDVGTGKPSAAERAARPHHLFDWVTLGERPSAGAYARAAAATCEALFARGVVPVLVGGSGLYLRALIEGLHAEPPHDPAVRERFRAEAESLGVPALHARLASVDPAVAARLDPNDRQRVTRALEVHATSGRPLSWWHAHPQRAGLAADWRCVHVSRESGTLATRIGARTRAMFAGGLIEETRALRDAGKEPALSALRAIGYDEALAVLAGTLDLPAACERTDARTRQMAKRQRTWFRHQFRATSLDADAFDAGGLAAAARAALGV